MVPQQSLHSSPYPTVYILHFVTSNWAVSLLCITPSGAFLIPGRKVQTLQHGSQVLAIHVPSSPATLAGAVFSKLILFFHSSIPWLNTSSSLPFSPKCVPPGTRSWPSHLCVSIQFLTCLFWSPALTGAISSYPGLSPPESAGPSFSFILMSCAPGTR